MTSFDLHRMVLNELPLDFLGEVAFRALFAYCMVFIFLKISGRRGVRQISLFELVVILTLGSAAGDVSFYDEVPLLPVAMVFGVLLALYKATTYLMSRYRRFGAWMEGKPVIIIRDGVYQLQVLRSKRISYDEFFMELRHYGVEHLGQVRLGILEVNGDVSLYFFAHDQVRPGLPVLPAELCVLHVSPPDEGVYACSHCGTLQHIAAHCCQQCPNCGSHTWVAALDSPRCR